MSRAKCQIYGGAALPTDKFVAPVSEAVRTEADITALLHAAGCVNCEVTPADRARQFMPFAALTGYYDLVKETEDDDAHAFETFREHLYDDIAYGEYEEH